MGSQRLNAKNIRRIERAAGTPILRAWAHGGYEHDFVTPDHRHGWWDKKTGKVHWDSEASGWSTFRCYDTCAELPPIQFGPPPEDE